MRELPPLSDRFWREFAHHALPLISITGLLLVTSAVFIGRTARPVAA